VAAYSKIEWTEATWNPTTGCDRISTGCDNCYALTLAARLKAMGNPKYQVDGDPRTSGPGFGVVLHGQAIELPYRWRQPRLVFVNSMSDLFHVKVPDAFIARVFDVMGRTPRHTYQVLTKRPKRAARLAWRLPWPANVWLGVTVEDRSTAWRLDSLRQIPAAVRFVSAEPLLESINGVDLSGVDWLIAGGESGPEYRTVDVEWIRELRDACAEERIAFFFKQWGGLRPKSGGRMLDGRTWDEMPTVQQRWSGEFDDGTRREAIVALAR
jgi:protein gp37